MWWDVGPAARTRAMVVVAVAAFAGVVVYGGRAHADPAEVESLIAQGNQLRREGQPGRALPFFQKAHELARTPRTEAQLGLAELAAGYFFEAEQHLAAALEVAQHPFVVSNKAPLTKALGDARAQIGELAIDGDPAGAAVKVNGRAVGTLPLAAPIRMSAGRADVELSADGHKSAARSVVVRGRQRHSVTIGLERLPAPSISPIASARPPGAPLAPDAVPPVAPPASSEVAASAVTVPATTTSTSTSPAAASTSTSGLRVAAWIVGGAALAALGTGVGFHLASVSTLKDHDRDCEVMNNRSMLMPDKATNGSTTDCMSLYNAWKTDVRWSIAGYIAGGALAVTSAILFWRSSIPPATAQAHLSCTPSAIGFTCGGRF